MIDHSNQDNTAFCAEARNVLQNTTIAIIGLGALGTHCAELLVRSGAQKLLLVDDDRVEASNLARQTIYHQEHLGEFKAHILSQELHKINSILTTVVSERFTASNNSFASSADIILDCTDSIQSRLDIDTYCQETKKPWVHASIYNVVGEAMVITPSSTNYSSIMNDKSDQGCDGVLSVTASMTASLQVSLLLQHIMGRDVHNKLYRLNTWNLNLDVISTH